MVLEKREGWFAHLSEHGMIEYRKGHVARSGDDRKEKK